MDAMLTAFSICCARLDEKRLLPVKLPAEVLEVLIFQLVENKAIAAGPRLMGRPRPYTPLKISAAGAETCRDYWSSFNTASGEEFACAMAAMEACCRTCALVRLAASAATSASLIWLSAAEKLVTCDWAREMA